MTFAVRRLGRIAYEDALALQESLVEAKHAGDDTDYLLLLEHDPVYTLGRNADAADLGDAPGQRGVPVFRVGRGGGVTYHGPGQLVAYPILTLPAGERDVPRYVARLEQVILDTCAEFGVVAERRAGHPGVWVGERKLASIGVAIRRWVTCHGLSLNVAPQQDPFGAVVACRMPGLRVTSLAEEAARLPTLEQVTDVLERAFERCFARQTPQERAA